MLWNLSLSQNKKFNLKISANTDTKTVLKSFKCFPGELLVIGGVEEELFDISPNLFSDNGLRYIL